MGRRDTRDRGLGAVMDFSDALRAVKDGKPVRRALWRELGGQVGLRLEISGTVQLASGELMPQLVCPLPDGRVGAFTGGSWDLLADDWELA